MNKPARRVALSFFMALLVVAALPATPQAVFINEIHYDNASTDTGEAIEIAGPAGTSLAGWSIVLYNGSNSLVYDTDALTGAIPNTCGGLGVVVVNYPTDGIQNGAPDGIALVAPGPTVVQFLSYEGVITALDGPALGMTSTNIGVSETGTTPIGQSLQLSGFGSAYPDFTWQAPAANTFGACNTGQTFQGPDPKINEFVANHVGTDTNEFIEIFGRPNTNYSTFTILSLEGDATGQGVIDRVVTIGTTNASGYWWTGYVPDQLENGTQTLLVVEGFTGAAGADLDTNNDGTLDTSPWSRLVDAVAVNDGGVSDLTYGVPVLAANYDGQAFTPGGASRIPNGADTDAAADWVRNDFDLAGITGFVGTPVPGEAYNTPNAVNQAVPTVEAAPAVVSTYPANGASNVPVGAALSVSFSEPVNVASGAFTLECPAGAGVSLTVSGGPTTFTLTPAASLPGTTLCTAKVLAANITDQDTADPPDAMAADYTWTFTTGSPLPNLSINDVSVTEGNAGTVNAAFTVSLSTPAGSGGVTFAIATANNTATTADNDYVAQSLTGQSIAAGGTTYTFNVTVNGDTVVEANETFFVNVTNVTGANVVDGQGVGTINNDDLPVVEIYQIQGSGAASPFANQYVITQANVVTAVGPEGFFIQTPAVRDDNNPDTSNGIYVFTGGPPGVSVADHVNVTGRVYEYFNFTEFSPVTSVTVLSSGNLLPAAIEFNASVPSPNPATPSCALQYECWEGMLVHVENGITSGPSQRFGTDPSAEAHGVASTSRPFREPGIAFPGLPGLPVWDGNPEVFEIDPDRLGAVPDPDYVPAGSTFSATGVLGYEFSGWELWPTAFTFTPPPPPVPVRARNDGEFTVGTFNLLQLDQSDTSNYATRLQKHSYYIRTVLGAPDVLGVQECMSLTELEDLANRIHDDDSSLTYTAHLFPGHDVGGIDNGFLVRDTVTATAVTQLGYSETFTWDGSPLHDRPPLLFEGTYDGNGAPFAFTVMVNHTRSLNSIDDPVDGPRVRAKRLEQAQSIAQKIQAYQLANPLRPYVMVGDLNAYEFTDGYVDVVGQMAGDFVPADNLLSGPDLVNPNMTKQALNVPAANRYSYIFGGSAQVLDHALTTQAAAPWVRGFAYGRGNADAPANYLNDPGTPLRASDHDGAVLFLMSDANGDGVPDDTQTADVSIAKVDSPDPVLPGGTLTYTLTVSNAGPAAAGPTTVTDTLPAGVTFGYATGTGWSCVQSTGVVSCTTPALPVGTAPNIAIGVTVTATFGTLTNTAEVSPRITDPNPGNNTVTATTVITPLTDLALAMSASTALTEPGLPFTHAATATNLGPSPATGVTLTLSLPAGATPLTVSPGACAAAGATVTCNVGSLAAGAAFAAQVEMLAATSGTYTTSGSVTGTELDPNPPNNTASATTSVGRIVATPSPVDMRVPVFSLGSTTLNITNDSPFQVGFSLVERRIEYAWDLATIAGPTWEVPVQHAADRTARMVPGHPLPQVAAAPLAPTAVLDFPVDLVYPWGIGFNTTASDLWVNDIAVAGGDNLAHRFLADGTPTGDTIDASAWVGVFAADMAYDPWANRLWQVNVGGDNCVHELNPAAKVSTGNAICPAFGVSQRGLAFDPVTDTFFAGSWNDGAVRRFDRGGSTLEVAYVGLEVSGLAYNPSTGHLFVLTNSATPADLYVLDVANAYATVASFKIAGMGNYAQAGLEADCAGNLYAVSQATAEVFVLPSGETGFCAFMDVPWLDETPKSGTITPGATQQVTLDFITALQWPGLHQASLRVAGTDPLAPVDVPVNYTIAFLDVPADHWADEFIHGLAGVRVTRGCGEGNFCPDAEVDRAEMAILMVRAMHGPLYVPPAATGVFVDVPVSDSDVTADYVEQLYRDGVVAGCAVGAGGELYYCPDSFVNRAEMAVFISRGIDLPPVAPPTGYFSDVHGTEWAFAEGFIEAIYDAGITAGCGDHLFCPATPITRAQLAVFLVKAFGFPYLPPTP